MKKLGLYSMALLYVSAGTMHFINPQFYLQMSPEWMPMPITLINLSGIAEIALGIFLLPLKTRIISAWLIIAMLVVFFFVIHIPMAIVFYQTNNPGFIISVIRLPIQFLLIWWAWMYTKKPT
jgi:uncharacterized membrane protein